MAASHTQPPETGEAKGLWAPETGVALFSLQASLRYTYHRQTPSSWHWGWAHVYVCFVSLCARMLCHLCLHKQGCTNIWVCLRLCACVSMQPCEYVSKCLHMSASQCACGSQTEITGHKHWSSNLGQGSLVTHFCQKTRCKERAKKQNKKDNPSLGLIITEDLPWAFVF